MSARLLALLSAVMMALALASPPATAQTGEVEVQPARVAGADRFDTAANISELTFPDADEVDVVHLATGEAFPDALAATYAAGAVDGPILLTASSTLPTPTLEEIERLDPDTVVLIGGTGAISDAVRAQVEAGGFTTDRITGVNRFQTASSVALTYGRDQGIVGTVDGDRTAVLASGEDFADALAIGPVAAALHLPLLLTPSGITEVSVNSALHQLEIDRILIVGGTAAVSADVEAHYVDQGYATERIAGANRMATAAAVADQAIDRFGFTPDLTLLARGNNYPDALAAGIHGAVSQAPLLLTATPGTLSGPTSDWFAGACPEISAIRAVGGSAAVSAATLDAAVQAAESCQDGDDGVPDLIVTPQEAITAAPGEAVEFSAPLRGTDQDSLWLALFPCEGNDVTGAGGDTFADADGDNEADGMGETDTGEALITAINGATANTRDAGATEAGPDGTITFTLASGAADCAIAVLWDQREGLGLGVNADGHPVEPYGVGQVTWQ